MISGKNIIAVDSFFYSLLFFFPKYMLLLVVASHNQCKVKENYFNKCKKKIAPGRRSIYDFCEQTSQSDKK